MLDSFNLPFSGKAAIAGIGYTDFMKDSGVSILTLANRACLNAIADAGLKPEEIDGIATYSVGDSVASHQVAENIGCKQLTYLLDQNGGGSTSHSVISAAAMAVYSGLAKYVVAFRAINGRSERRMGRIFVGKSSGERQFTAPHGVLTPPQGFAFPARAYMLKYGITSRQFGAVAVSLRKKASLNPRAMMRTPISIEDHQASRMICDPLRLLDCCLETDGACAFLITSAERVKDLKQRPVYIMAAASGGGYHPSQWLDWAESTAHRVAPRLFGTAGIAPRDIGAAMLYDAFTYMVLVALEAYGFCKPGEAGLFVESGGIEMDGQLPVNTHGGMLSEGYMHGFNQIIEAVEQLRGSAGSRQLKDIEIILSAAQPGMRGGTTSALILRR